MKIYVPKRWFFFLSFSGGYFMESKGKWWRIKTTKIRSHTQRNWERDGTMMREREKMCREKKRGKKKNENGDT